MKARNLHIHGTVSEINRLREDYLFIGKYHVEIVEPGHLVVYALPPKKEEKKKSDDKRGGRKQTGNQSSGRQGDARRDRS